LRRADPILAGKSGSRNPQYQFHVGKYERWRKLNRIILSTPNEGLSEQHFREFEAAGLAAELLHKDGL
jgi:hypothetical protein